MANITRDREIISEIYSQSGGFLGDTEQEKALGNFLGAPVLKAAAKAWTSDTRFFYELIQNSDDCSYTWAESQKKRPSLWFDFKPGRIIVHCNEDGFEESHVRALCSAGKRTKTGQIGEKGIGFKSLFKVAWKVQIQSGPFCFSLQHREGQNGLGMIAPVNEAHEDLSEDVRTQFTLFLISPEHYLDLRDKLLNFPLTITAFLRNTKMVGVWRQHTFLTFSSVRNYDEVCLCLRNGSGIVRRADFILFTQKVAGLPRRDSRPFPGSTEMTLAFPFSSELPPAVSTAEYFAHSYLPLSAAGGSLNFLVQSDFIVQDNRESLACCPWNDHLLSELPQVFHAALKTLSSMERFEYSWPQFLPTDDTKRPQWAQFHKSVKQDLKHLRIFKTVKGTLKTLEEVRYLQPEHCDSKGNPLFSDSEEDVYLSTQYSEYYGILSTFGLQPISSHQLLHRLRRHLSSILFGKATFEQHLEDDWYTKVASLVLSWMDSPLHDFVKEVEALHLVPVYEKSLFDPIKTLKLFKSPRKTDIYFPHDTCGNLIPDSIIDTVPVASAANDIQKQLFTRLGVKRASQAFVIQCIYSLNDKRIFRPGLSQSVQNLRYMFLAAPDGRVIDTERVLLYDDAGKALMNLSHSRPDIYFKTADVYGMSEIYRLAHRLPSLPVCFLHPSYTTDFQNDTAWKSWLEDTCCIRTVPRLETLDSPGRPSDILKCIVRYLPDRLIGILKVHWDTYEKELANASPATVSYIKAALVPTACGKVPLEDTYLGLPEMTDIWSDSLKDKFPFLSIPSMWASGEKVNWEFLSRFGVTTTLTADYLLESLSRLSQVSPREHARIGFFKLYAVLADHPFAELWDRFEVNKYIYIPDKDAWCEPSECVWSAFPITKRKYGIRQLYPDLKEFLVDGLGVYTPGVGDCVYEIELAASVWDPTSGQVSALIQELSGLNPTSKELQRLELTRFLPVRQWGSYALYVTVHDEFVIVDDVRFGVSSSVPVLSMTREEVCRSRAFIEAMGLASRYVSRQLIEETYVVKDEGQSDDLTLAMRQKAEFLYRPRFTLSRGKSERVFSQATVYIATDLKGFFKLEGGLNVRNSHPGRVHIEDADSTLRIYVPLDPKQRAISYATELPRALVRVLLIRDETACDAFATVLREPVDILDDILTEKGVIQLPTTEPKGQGLAIRTKTQAGSEKQISHSIPSSSYMKSTRNSAAIMLEASEECIKKQKTLSSRLTALSRKYSPADIEVGSLGTMSPLFGYLFSEENRHLTTIAAAMDMAAQSFEPVWISFLLGSPEIYGPVTITNSAIEIAMQNEVCGNEITRCLFEYLGRSGQEFTVTEAHLQAAAENERCGRQIMPVLLDYAKDKHEGMKVITAKVLRAAVENTECGDALVSLLLEQQNINVAITEDVVIAAAENEDHGCQIMEQLLEHDSHITMSSAIFTAAAGNMEQGLDITKLLLQHTGDNTLITEDVIISAMRNDMDGLHILELLKEHCESLDVTENILIAATEGDNCDDILEFLGLSPDSLITSSVIEATAGSPFYEIDCLRRLLDLKSLDTEVTEAAILGAVRWADQVELLVKHQGRLTDAFLVAAVSTVDWPLKSAILDQLLAHGLRITEPVLVAAAANPGHGITVVPMLLASDKEIRISESVILAAVTNPGSYTDGIVQILWDRQPDVPITEETIIAAASTDTSAVVRLIELINASPDRCAVRIGRRLLEALSGNRSCGAKALRLLLEDLAADEKPIPVTEEALINAAGNTGCGFEVMDLLLDHGHVLSDRMSEEALIAAAGNSLWGLELLVLFVDHDYPLSHSRKVVNAAQENIWAGEEILAFILRHVYTDDYVLDGGYSSEDEGSMFSGDTEVPEDGDFTDDKNSSESAEGSEEAYETADDG
ncbi:hypothetical protein ASPVEDRAFT_119596 [Aspergillus versicolor CBS 583.65]|uniref:Protein NO VEIN C-terminal domain-containing protein n=1 Tax=Aspergillus versicolor CBS 583.65 TaxID=1036611 RepID=A0A1L9P2T9_ASPVE|nr:uncharacterized protein ASPVEDRAFT_119596 [Aspergillus versicolor CBS 583.65]OJI95845.1 hypothetical protein ASPVEDRAFT_119596 [Aspergillus versicolor CBS 583.65]